MGKGHYRGVHQWPLSALQVISEVSPNPVSSILSHFLSIFARLRICFRNYSLAGDFQCSASQLDADFHLAFWTFPPEILLFLQATP